MQLPEIILSSFNTALTQFGEDSLISCSTSLTCRQNIQTDLHLTANFHLWAQKRVSFLQKRKLKLISQGSFLADFNFYFVTLANRRQRAGIAQVPPNSAYLLMEANQKLLTGPVLTSPLITCQVTGTRPRKKYRNTCVGDEVRLGC